MVMKNPVWANDICCPNGVLLVGGLCVRMVGRLRCCPLLQNLMQMGRLRWLRAVQAGMWRRQLQVRCLLVLRQGQAVLLAVPLCGLPPMPICC